MTLRAAALALVLVLPAQAQDTETLLITRRAAQALAQAAVALEEAAGASDRVTALARTVRAYEEGLTALREGLRRAAIREQAIRAALEARRAEIARLTAALSGLDQRRAPNLLLHPAGPLATVRSAILLEALAPALRAEAAALRAELDEAAMLRSLRDGAAATLDDGLTGARAARLALSRAISERDPPPRRFVADPEALAAILSGADTLESFAAGLAAVPLAGAEGAGGAAFRDARGDLPLPVEAAPLRGFAEADAAGAVRPGLVLATRPQALVTAPAAATVRYAGPLRDYGNVIVLEPGPGYLVVLAGIGRLYAQADEVVTAGAPLGLMGGPEAGAGEIADVAQQGAGGGRSETLYIEIRVGGAPVDPAQWFAPRRG